MGESALGEDDGICVRELDGPRPADPKALLPFCTGRFVARGVGCFEFTEPMRACPVRCAAGVGSAVSGLEELLVPPLSSVSSLGLLLSAGFSPCLALKSARYCR